MKRRLGSDSARFEPETPISEEGSANRTSTSTLLQTDDARETYTKIELPKQYNYYIKCKSIFKFPSPFVFI